MLETPKLDLGRVISGGFSVIQRRWPVLGVFVLGSLALDWAEDLTHFVRYKAGSHELPSFAVYIGDSLVLLLVAWLRDIGLTGAAVQPASPRPSVAVSLGAAFRALPTLLPVAIVVALPSLIPNYWLMWTGFDDGVRVTHFAEILIYSSVAATIFWLALAAGWGLLIPVVVVERRRLIPALGRAWNLISGNRWRLLALFVVVGVIGSLPGILGPIVTLPITEAIHYSGRLADFRSVERLVSRAFEVIVASVWPVMTGVIYLELRRLRDGIADGDVSEIFA
jgi:hypothetical protein